MCSNRNRFRTTPILRTSSSISDTEVLLMQISSTTHWLNKLLLVFFLCACQQIFFIPFRVKSYIRNFWKAGFSLIKNFVLLVISLYVYINHIFKKWRRCLAFRASIVITSFTYNYLIERIPPCLSMPFCEVTSILTRTGGFYRFEIHCCRSLMEHCRAFNT